MNGNYAGFWLRFGATLIDMIVFSILFVMPVYFIYGEQMWTSEDFLLGFWDVLFTYILPFIVTIWLWLRFMGTPGKTLLNLKIVDANTEEPLSLKQAILRYFAYLVSLLPLCLGFIWIAFDERKQGWHDKIANSVVLKQQ